MDRPFWGVLGAATLVGVVAGLLSRLLLGFFVNQWLFYLLLTYLLLPYFISLAIVMVIVATSTYLLSRLWAFRTEGTESTEHTEDIL